jgi:hypothetical protein
VLNKYNIPAIARTLSIIEQNESVQGRLKQSSNLPPPFP